MEFYILWRRKMNKNYIIFVLAVVLVGLSFYTTILFNENNLYEDIFVIEAKAREIDEIRIQATQSYDRASISYDLDEYDLVISYCEDSRDLSSKYMQEMRQLAVQVDEHDDEIFAIFSDMIREYINIYTNLYESCEYFESAARQYENGDYDGGDASIELHNEKIRLHDAAVERSNQLLARYNHELSKLGGQDVS